MDQNSCIVDFEPIGKRVEIEKGSTLLEAAQCAGIELAAICGGVGTCEQCKVQIVSGSVESANLTEQSVFPPEMIKNGWRLACQTLVRQSLKVFTPPDSLSTLQRLQEESTTEQQDTDLSFSVKDMALNSTDLKDALDQLIDTDHQSFLHERINNAKGLGEEKLRVVYKDGVPMNFVPAGSAIYGLAVDLGTTKIAAYLVDLLTGRTAARSSAMNPQIFYGEDVISRILYCMDHDDGRTLMQKLIVDVFNDLINKMCAQLGISANQVIESVVVGNTAMQHLFAGLPVKQLGLAPYSPAITTNLTLKSGQLGLAVSPGSTIFIPENIAGYVGGDHVAMMLAAGLDTAQDTAIGIDIGTNTEISLVTKGKIYTCSCASGPAFEGAHIKEGMRAAEGAIERISIEGDQVRYLTIGNSPPLGICGSGILDAVGELRRNHILDERGKLDPARLSVRGEGKTQEYVLVPVDKTGVNRDITLTRRDVHEILLAKAAIQSGFKILLATAGIESEQIERVIVAGAFGSYLDLHSAIQIGMFPDIPEDRYFQVGNAAGSGARQMLISTGARKRATEFAGKVDYVELTLYPDFQKVYFESLVFRPFW